MLGVGLEFDLEVDLGSSHHKGSELANHNLVGRQAIDLG